MAKLKDTRGKIQVKAGPEDGLEEGEFQAYASVFGNIDSYGDVVMPGAFTESLKEYDDAGLPIPLLFGHNMQDPDYNLGTVEAVEDERGLLIKAKLALDEPKAAQVYRLLKGRRINQMSFAYDVLEGGWAVREKADGSQEEYYELRKLKLYEVSVVPIGANQETEVLAVKGLEALEQLAQGGRVPDAVKDQLRPAYEILGTLLKGSTQDAAASTPDPSAEEARKGNSGQASPVSVNRQAAEMELTLLDL